jgi:opacity protein-like surface antigen
VKTALLLCALTLLTAFPALAASQDYVGGNIAFTIPQDADFDYENSARIIDPPATFESSYDSGLGFGLVFGKSYDNNLRIEGELGYRSNDLDSFSDEGEALGAAGDITAVSFLFNTYYDIANPSRFTPYLGAGLGGAYVSLDARLIDPEFDDIVYSDETFALAYQLGGGVAYRLNRMLTLDLGYRYFSTTNLKLRDETADLSEVGAPLNRFETDYSAHNLALGLRLAF